MSDTSVRLDKWLWAARFFKTRAKAKEAIVGGKVHLEGARGKPSRELKLDEVLVIRQGYDEREVVVRGLSDVRRGAPDAAKLYEETPDSIARREKEAEQRRAAGPQTPTQARPTKRDRRLIHRFREDRSDSS